MKKYLFFDCEFATSKGGEEKICEFGYVLVDDRFNVIYKGNIVINPNIKPNEWDYRVVRKILTRPRYVYENQLNFSAYYKKIEFLVKSADYILGHSLASDAHALNCDCKRYNLPSLDYTFYDIKEFYKSFIDTRKDVSVENILASLNIKGDENSHDAEADAYNTMLELKAMLLRLEMKLEDLIDVCPKAKDKTENYLIESRLISAMAQEENQRKMMEGDYSDGTNDLLKMGRHHNKRIFVQFLDNVQVTATGRGLLKDKKVSISLNYECCHFKEMMNIVQIIKNEGGEYVLKGSESNLFVTYDSFDESGNPRQCNRLKYALQAINDGASIEIITFEQFLKMLGMTNDELESLPLPSIDCLFREDAIIKDKRSKRMNNSPKKL